MSNDEKFNKEVWGILREIKGAVLFANSSTITWKHPPDSQDPILRNSFSFEKGEKMVLANLEKIGAIQTFEQPVMFLFAGTEALYDDRILSDKRSVLCLRIIQPKFDKVYEEYERENTPSDINHQNQSNPRLKSIHLVSSSLSPKDTIFLVLDERFETPTRFNATNKKGEPSYIKRLYDVAYFADAPGKKVDYDKNLNNSINNDLFKKKSILNYMRTNKLEKPTIVKKSKDKTLVLNNEIIVKIGLIDNIVPTQYKSLYIDKTR